MILLLVLLLIPLALAFTGLAVFVTRVFVAGMLVALLAGLLPGAVGVGRGAE